MNTTQTLQRASSSLPKWIGDVERLLPIRAQFVLAGNIRDVFVLPTESGAVLAPFLSCLWSCLMSKGYEFLLVYDRIDGLRIHPADAALQARAAELLELKFQSGVMACSPESLLVIARRLTAMKGTRAALVIDYASRLTPSPQSPETTDYRFFAGMEKLSLTASPVIGRNVGSTGTIPLFNSIFWLLNRAQDIPSWYRMDSERTSAITIQQPDYETRLAAAATLATLFPKYTDTEPADRKSYEMQFADGTDGMSLQAMADIAQIARLQQINIIDVGDAVRCFKVGAVDNPWRKEYLREKIRNGQASIEERVKGQHQAVVKTIDILMRSVMGLTGAQVRAAGSRPRGVLFFAGPTGVGKTELAKVLSKVLFGDERAYIRFDMSEFSEEHSAARLMGAPPGYVGYEAGGELTNAIRQRPFSVVLFDEIEKCHPRLLDKFLQILEDGRLTDGQGNTVYFSESVLIFTSNLGIIVEADDGTRVQNVKAGDSYEVVNATVRRHIEEYFKFRLGRPELVNRIGDNIVVFNFITPDVGHEILDGMIRNIQTRVKGEHRLSLEFSDETVRKIADWCLKDLSNGGRGIGNRLESVLINPLARALFDRREGEGDRVVVSDIQESTGVFSVVIE